jgi:hypothetical protein
MNYFLNWRHEKRFTNLEGILNNNNGCSYIQELNWTSNSDLQFFTDNAGEKLWAVLRICMERGPF